MSPLRSTFSQVSRFISTVLTTQHPTSILKTSSTSQAHSFHNQTSEKMAVIYIIYNADGSLFGKLKYGYKKLGSSSSESSCSACDLTHNGLNLTETTEWAATKKKIPAEVQQLHRDELSSEVRAWRVVTSRLKSCHQATANKGFAVQLEGFIANENIKFLVILGQDMKGSDLKMLMDKSELVTCSKDHEKFLSILDQNASLQGIHLRA